MVQHPGADHMFETASQFRRTLHWQLTHVKIVELAFLLELLGVFDAADADIDPGDLGARPGDGVLGCLRGSTARDQYAAIIPVGLIWPEQAGIGAPPIIVPALSMALQAIDRRRVGVTLVKGAHLLRYAGGIRPL